MNASVIFTSVAVAATIAIGPAASVDATSATTHHTGINQLTFACGPPQTGREGLDHPKT
jgi:hypothetical protein